MTDLARTTLDANVTVLAKGRALHREGHGGAGVGGLAGERQGIPMSVLSRPLQGLPGGLPLLYQGAEC